MTISKLRIKWSKNWILWSRRMHLLCSAGSSGSSSFVDTGRGTSSTSSSIAVEPRILSIGVAGRCRCRCCCCCWCCCWRALRGGWEDEDEALFMSYWGVQGSAMWKVERVGFADGYCRFLQKWDCKVGGSRVKNAIKSCLNRQKPARNGFSRLLVTFKVLLSSWQDT